MASSALDDLREAAELLRTRAEAATRGPWQRAADHPAASDQYPANGFGYWSGEYARCVSYSGTGDGVEADLDAIYIVTVHPGVGLALARLLDEHADSVEEDGGQVVTSAVDQAVELARLILGRADV